MTDEPFINFAFPATGTGTMTRRTMPDRLGDVINVKDWNATGNGSTSDTAAIQAAIDYAQDIKKGGIVFFPPGSYVVSALAVGSNTTPNAGVRLVGCNSQCTTITGSVSNGGRTYDNLSGIEGFSLLGTIILNGTNQYVLDIYNISSIDASRAQGAFISNIRGNTGSALASSAGPSVTGASGATIGSFFVALGNQCTAQNVRVGGGRDIAYMLSGYNPTLLGSSVEVARRGVRVGWAPTFTLSATATSGSTVTFASLPVGGVTVGRYVSDSGGKIPANTTITAVDTVNHTITLSHATTGSCTTVTFMNECPAYGPAVIGLQTEQTDFCVELYNCQGGYISGCVNQAQIGSPPVDATCDISTITWASNVATVTTASPHNLASGTQILQIVIGTAGGGQSQFLPAYSNPPGWLVAARTGPSTFTYDLPLNPGVTYTTHSLAWTYPQYYAFRCRTVYDTAIFGLSAGNFALADIDLNFDDSVINGVISGDSKVQFRNNMLWAAAGFADGLALPTDKTNLAGFNFNGVFAGVNRLEGHGGYTGKSTVNVVEGNMIFADLPGQAGVFQPGPYEGQEFNIADGALAGGGTAVFGSSVQGGGVQHIRVRWTAGSVNAWTRMA